MTAKEQGLPELPMAVAVVTPSKYLAWLSAWLSSKNWEPTPDGTHLYTADQMRAYALAALASDTGERGLSVAQGQGFVLDAGSTRYLCDGPNGYFYTGDMEIARRLVNIIDPAPTAEGDWTITDLTNPYGPAAPAQPDGTE